MIYPLFNPRADPGWHSYYKCRTDIEQPSEKELKMETDVDLLKRFYGDEK
jgi:hypothetical protein